MKAFNEHGGQEIVSYEAGGYALHGDVILAMESLPANFESMQEVPDACLAYGEMTGHVHQIIGQPHQFLLRQDPETMIRHLRVVEPVYLKH
jgi:hypothetical protein